MKTCRIIFFCCIILLPGVSSVYAQCKTGDCNNGKGTYNFGWCIYSGQFKNGKPEGTGTMQYDDYSYTGEFKNGVEDGSGIITYKNGRTENVRYEAGTKLTTQRVDSASYKPLEGQDDECILGNCRTGYGTVLFPSGNKYVGNFVNRKRQGRGVFYFANGDRFEGTFENDLRQTGTYAFYTGYAFTGTFFNDDFYNGTFTSPEGVNIRMVNGQVIPPVPKAVPNMPTAGAANPACTNTVSCPRCSGKGISYEPIQQKLSWSTRDSYSVDRYGNKTLTYAGQSGGNTYSIPNYVPCARCNGKGSICK